MLSTKVVWLLVVPVRIIPMSSIRPNPASLLGPVIPSKPDVPRKFCLHKLFLFYWVNGSQMSTKWPILTIRVSISPAQLFVLGMSIAVSFEIKPAFGTFSCRWWKWWRVNYPEEYDSRIFSEIWGLRVCFISTIDWSEKSSPQMVIGLALLVFVNANTVLTQQRQLYISCVKCWFN